MFLLARCMPWTDTYPVMRNARIAAPTKTFGTKGASAPKVLVLGVSPINAATAATAAMDANEMDIAGAPGGT